MFGSFGRLFRRNIVIFTSQEISALGFRSALSGKEHGGRAGFLPSTNNYYWSKVSTKYAALKVLG